MSVTVEQLIEIKAYEAWFESVQRALITNTRAEILYYWRDLDDWRDADIAKFNRLAVPVQNAAHGSIATLSATKNGAILKTLGVKSTASVIPQRDISLGALRGTADSEVFKRVANEMYYKISRGDVQFSDIVRGAEDRISTVSQSSIQQAKVRSETHYLKSVKKVTGALRVLSGAGKHCALCVLAASRVYRTTMLMPIHNNCTCGVRPIVNNVLTPSSDIKKIISVNDSLNDDERKFILDSTGNGVSLNINENGQIGPELISLS